MIDSSKPRVIPLHPPACDHQQVSLDVDTQTLVCRSCHVEVDPLSWLVEHGLQYTDRMQQQRDVLEERNDALRRECARLEAQVARLRRRVHGMGRDPSAPLPPDVGQVLPIGDRKRPLGILVRLSRDGRLSPRDGRQLADTIHTVLDGLPLG